jgi:hypothetical protein
MGNYATPAIPLPIVYAKVLAGGWHIRQEAQQSMLALDETLSVRLCLLSLAVSDFRKSMDAEEPKWAGCRQDVYATFFGGFDLYVKFQIWPLAKELLFVVSFKEL